MNLTGDSNLTNQGTTPVVFGPGYSYPVSPLNLGRFIFQDTQTPSTAAVGNDFSVRVTPLQQATLVQGFGSSVQIPSHSLLAQQAIVPTVGSCPEYFAPQTGSSSFSEHVLRTNIFEPSTSSVMFGDLHGARSCPVPGIRRKPVMGGFGCKRKTETPSPIYPKQHITEERMAERMSNLHISSETPSCSRETQPIRQRRLYMCDEMRRLQSESIIPQQILAKVNRPCTALVPWTPPIVPPIGKENNNNEEEPDNYLPDDSGMDMES